MSDSIKEREGCSHSKEVVGEASYNMEQRNCNKEHLHSTKHRRINKLWHRKKGVGERHPHSRKHRRTS